MLRILRLTSLRHCSTTYLGSLAQPSISIKILSHQASSSLYSLRAMCQMLFQPQAGPFSFPIAMGLCLIPPSLGIVLGIQEVLSILAADRMSTNVISPLH